MYPSGYNLFGTLHLHEYPIKLIPADVATIFYELGEMHGWGSRNCSMIDWWLPLSIEESSRRQLWMFDIKSHGIERGEELLGFAWDCDAKLYLLDTGDVPWSAVYVDGLDAEEASKRSDPTGKNRIATQPIEEVDFLAIIERWAFE